MPYNVNLSFGTLAELVLACVLLLAAARYNRLGRVAWVTGLRLASRAARRPRLLLLAAAAVPVIVRVILLIVDPVPQPYVMEEFNHLFLVDTYMHGRLANPEHPLAILLQTYQQLQWPHYMSARPPLPPIFLFFGEALVGSPFAGNLLALALTSAALCWMLQGWVSARWAALGTFLTVVTCCLFGYWVNSYWAPTTIVLGGAILLGLVPRIEQRPRFVWGVLFAFALVLLAGTRPYENGVYAGTICLWLAWRFLQPERRPMLLSAIVRVVLPVALVCVGIVAAQMWYNEATTGNFRLMPYQIWRVSQDMTPIFLWQPMTAQPLFYYEGLARFVSWNVRIVEDITEGGLYGALLWFSRHGVSFRDLLGPFLFIPFLCWSSRWLPVPNSETRTREYLAALCVVAILLALCGPVGGAVIKGLAVAVLILRWRHREERLAIVLLLVGIVATSLPAFYMNIYFAAWSAPMLLLAIKGLPNLARWHRPYGQSLAGFMLLGAALVPIGQTAALAVGVEPRGPSLSHFDLRYPSPREEVLARLDKMPGEHVVFVHHRKRVLVDVDPVWNSAEVDAQKVVWLRDLRKDWVAAAQRYYAGRTFWRMTLDKKGKYRLERYPSASLPAPAPLGELPNPDRLAAEAMGARKT